MQTATGATIDYLIRVFTALLLADKNLKITSANTAVEATFGYSASELIGRTIDSLLPEAKLVIDDQSESSDYQHYLHSESLVNARHKEGKDIAVRLKFLQEAVDNVASYTLIASDVSGLLAALDDYEESLSAYKTLNDLCPIGILELDQSLKATRFNDYWVTLSGLAEEETQGYGWISAISMEDAQTCLDMRESLTREEAYLGHFRLQSPLGLVHW